MFDKDRKKEIVTGDGKVVLCTLNQVLAMRQRGILIQIYSIATQKHPRAIKVHLMRDVRPY